MWGKPISHSYPSRPLLHQASATPDFHLTGTLPYPGFVSTHFRDTSNVPTDVYVMHFGGEQGYSRAMRLGVDFGTTRTTVALVDRGNYPLVSFDDSDGDSHEYVPSLVALDGLSVVYGFEAQKLAESGAPFLRSIKRLLAAQDANLDSVVQIGSREFKIVDLVTGFLIHVGSRVRAFAEDKDGPLEAVVGVPAHAYSAQRFITLEAFRRARFDVVAMLNEPSAAGYEYTHRHSSMISSRRTKVLVYDLGGGTFDASLVSAEGTNHEVLASEGNNLLGGDDFDEVLAVCALEALGVARDSMSDPQWSRLLEDARSAKEALHPQTRSIVLRVHDQEVSLPVDAFYTQAKPLVEQTLLAMQGLVDRDANGQLCLPDDVSGLYVVGGGSELPLILRQLRERFGRRVRRSPYSAGSTAIGLAIAADEEAGYSLVDKLSRGLGVFREWSSGAVVSFDPLLTPDMRVSPGEGVAITRSYRAVHNVGWYRFAEYTSVDEDGAPRGDVMPLGEIAFPFDPNLRSGSINLAMVPVERTGPGCLVEEEYRVDPHGIVSVTIRDAETGFAITRSLGD